MTSSQARGRKALGFVAVVHAPDSVNFATTAGTRAALIERVAEYVAGAADDRLTSQGAAQVRGLLANGRPERAIERYFMLVGERWDKEWLVTAAIWPDTQPAALALVDGVVPDTGGMAAVA